MDSGLLYQRTVAPALALSFAWALVVWCFGKWFGVLLTTTAMPLTGARGAVSLYALIGVITWPNGRRDGLVGVGDPRIAWAVLAARAWLRVQAPSSSGNAVASAINTAPSG
ncbi:MAG: hypothetical protein KGL15_04850 [Acidobacteriota bacterium]|nr:hypothetical protein [Acidobacteriota bacterium]